MGFLPLSTCRDTQPVHVALRRVPEHGGQGGGEQSAFAPSCSQGFLFVLRVNAICTEEEEEEREEESILHGPK